MRIVAVSDRFSCLTLRDRGLAVARARYLTFPSPLGLWLQTREHRGRQQSWLHQGRSQASGTRTNRVRSLIHCLYRRGRSRNTHTSPKSTKLRLRKIFFVLEARPLLLVWTRGSPHLMSLGTSAQTSGLCRLLLACATGRTLLLRKTFK